MFLLSGSLLFNPVFAALVSQYDWRVPFRCASVLIAITGFPCCWFFTVNDTPAAERLIDDDELSVSTMDMTQTQLEQQQFEDDLQSKKLIPKCCTMEIIRQRPEIIFWYIGNCLSYIGFYMPFVNLVRFFILSHFCIFLYYFDAIQYFTLTIWRVYM